MQNEKSNPLASIVLPVHNGEKYLAQAIDSCLSQTYTNFELVIVNDESTDNTSNILEEYKKKDSRINVLNTDKQISLGNVLNIGIKESKGEYIVRMDADDLMYPDRLERQIQFLEENQNVVVVGGQIEIIDDEGKVIKDRNYPTSDSDLKKSMFIFQPFAHPAITIKKSILLEVGLYPQDLQKVEDSALMFLLSQKGEFANLDSKVLKYRVTYSTESQSDIADHFARTNEVRNWATKKLGIKPSFRELWIWNIQKVLVKILNVLPNNISMNIFELGRSILK